MADLHLEQVRRFLVVADELSFTRAAASLHVAQQALSAQVARLERDVGAKLLRRTARGVALTPAGAQFAERARALVADADALLDETRAVADGRGGTLCIGFIGNGAGGAQGPLVEALADYLPHVRISLRPSPFTDPTAGVLAGDADMAFTYGPIDHPDLEIHELFSEPLCYVMRRDHPLVRRPRLHASQLVDEPCITIVGADNDPLLATWSEFHSRRHAVAGQPRPVLAVIGTVEEFLLCVAKGGVHAAPRSVAHFFRRPELAVRASSNDSPRPTFIVVSRVDAPATARRARTFAVEWFNKRGTAS